MDSIAFACRRFRWIGGLFACAAGIAVAPAQAQTDPPRAEAVPARPDAARPDAARPDPARPDAPRVSAAAVNPLERSVKAAFLYKFLGYTEFPPSAFADASAPVVIGVMGADDVAAELTRVVSGRTAMGRPVVVRQLREGDTPAQVHLLFVGGSDGARVRDVLRSVKGAPMLLVTESEQGLLHGSVINFKIIDERVRFDISLEAADRNSVKLSSRLLTVANNVYKGAP